MAGPTQTIRSYLVKLGWAPERDSWAKFDDELKRTGQRVEKYAANIAKDFSIAGGVAATALATVAGATLGIMKSTADSDLRYQVLARRMFMTTEATKKMKMATDALGYSLEEIIWGPPELAERYRGLIQDQDRMFRFLGSDGGERAFRTFRDLEFQGTRMSVALQTFGMVLTNDIIKKLTGTGSMEEAIKVVTGWVDRFEQKIPGLASDFTNVLVPAIKAAGEATQWLWNTAVGAVNAFQALRKNGIGALWDKDKDVNSNLNTLLGTDKDQVIGDIVASSKNPKDPADTAMMLALAEQESGFNPSAVNGRTGAFGLGQVMPKNWPSNKDRGSEKDQIEVMKSIMSYNLGRRKGNLKDALHDYYGWGQAGPGEPTFEQYYSQFMSKYQKYQQEWGGGARLQDQGYKIEINIDKDPSKLKEEVKRAVVEGIRYHEHQKSQQNFAYRQGVS